MSKRIIFIFSFFILISAVSAGTFQDSSENDFANGFFYRTFYNGSGNFVQLNVSEGFSFGNYTSEIFDAGANATWKNFSWSQGVCYRCALPNNAQVENGNFVRTANMNGNVFLAHLDEGVGATSFSDSSGNGNSGGCSGSNCPASTVNSMFERAFDFESGGPDDYINFGNGGTLNGFGDELTLEAWIKLESSPNGEFPSIIDKEFDTQFSMYISGSTDFLVTDLVTDNGPQTAVGNIVYNTGVWYHAAFVYDGSEMRLYTNGVLDGAPVAQSGTVASNSRALLVGAGWSGASVGFPFDGIIDEVAIYNRSLSQQEITDHYLRGIGRLNLSVRSCNDEICNGEGFLELNGQSPQNISLNENRYFQYKIDFNSTGIAASPELYGVQIDYLSSDVAPPSVTALSPSSGSDFVVNSTVEIAVNVSDENGVDRVVANLIFPNSSFVNLTLLNSIGDKYNNSFNVFDLSGRYNVSFFANDSFGNVNDSEGTYFNVANPDVTAPSVVLITPQNGSSTNEASINFSASFSDNVALSNVSFYVWNATGSLIETTTFFVSGTENITSAVFSLPEEGTYFWNALVYDNSSNFAFNESNNTFYYVDDSFPLFSYLSINPENGTQYSDETYSFSATVEDLNLQYAGIEFDGLNYTWAASNYLQNFSFNVSNLGAGTYAYYWWANDSFGNYNLTETEYYSITRADSDVKLFLNGARDNLSILYETQINASAQANVSEIVLYRNGVDVTLNENGKNTTLGAGYYNYTAFYEGNQNYSSGSETWFLNVAKANRVVALFLNNLSENVSTSYGQQLNASAFATSGDVHLYRNGISVDSQNGLNIILEAGEHIYVANVSSDENYTGDSKSLFVNVSRAQSSASLIFSASSPQVYGATINATCIGSNPEEESFLYRNEIDVTLNENGLSVLLGAGTYDYVCNVTQTQNYSSASNSSTFIITQAEGNVSLLLNGAAADLSVQYPQETNVSASTLFGNLFVYLNGIEKNSENNLNVSRAAGFYNVSVFSSGNENHSAASQTLYLNISKANSIVYAYLNNSRENISVYKGDSIYINGSLEYGENVIEIYLDKELINRGEGGIGNLTLFNEIGLFEVNVSYSESENYSSSSEVFYVNVNERPDEDSPNLTVLSPSAGETFELFEEIEIAVNASDDTMVDYASANVSFPNGTVLLLELYNLSEKYNSSLVADLVGDYNVRFFANDSFGNVNDSEGTYFVVENNEAPPPSESSSGNSGGGNSNSNSNVNSSFNSNFNLQMQTLEDISIKRGSKLPISVSVTNTGESFLSACGLEVEGINESWIGEIDKIDLDIGENYVYNFEITSPEDAEAGIHTAVFVVECDEFETSKEVDILVYKTSYEAEIIDYARRGNSIAVRYLLKEFEGVEHDVQLFYVLLDSQGLTRYKGEERVILPANGKVEDSLTFDLPQDSAGEFRFNVELDDGSTKILTSSDIFLPSNTGIFTGFVISEGNKRIIRWICGIIIVAVVFYLVYNGIRTLHRKRRHRGLHLRLKKFFR